MGACHNLSRTKPIIRANIQENTKNNLTSDLASKNSLNSKSNLKYDSSRSNISSNTTSTQINQKSNPNQYIFYLPATLGEIEVPILVERKEKIIIKLNQTNNNNNEKKNTLWSFLPNENPVNYLGYNTFKYNNANIGSLFLRISGDNKIYHLNKTENKIIANDKGYLLFFANLNKNDYPIYQPKGSLFVIVYGGNYNDNELYHSNNINSFSNKNKINLEDKKEYKILDYINKVRNNPKKFYHSYFCINDQINLELKEFIYKISKRKELNICNELNKLAKMHCEDLCENETAGFIGTDGFDLNYEMKKNNIICNTYGESIIYNINNPLLIVKNMIQDIYSKKKKNRENLFFDKFNKVGIYLKEHPIYKYCCVLIFSD